MPDEVRPPRNPFTRIAITLAWIVGAAVALLVLAHVFIRPVAPGQTAPAGHFSEPCVACHLVSDGAAIIDYDD